MRPAPIEDDLIIEGTQRVVVGPPGNNLDSRIMPVEALVGRINGIKMFSVRCILEPGDLERLQAGAAVWLTFCEFMVPFEIQVGA